MLLYHGSNVEVQKPDPAIGRERLDFGPGFYTTTMPEQAEAWARRKAYEFDQAIGVVSVYQFDASDDLHTLSFDKYSVEWLEFVVENRRTGITKTHLYDVVSGGIADDRVIDTINYYIEELTAGRSSDELLNLTLKQLSYQKPNDQVCFSTNRSIDSLTYIESYEVAR